MKMDWDKDFEELADNIEVIKKKERMSRKRLNNPMRIGEGKQVQFALPVISKKKLWWLDSYLRLFVLLIMIIFLLISIES